MGKITGGKSSSKAKVRGHSRNVNSIIDVL